jgi:hypothetical protein
MCHLDTILTHPAVNAASNGMHVSSVQTMFRYKKRIWVITVDGYGEKERSAKRSADLASKTLAKAIRGMKRRRKKDGRGRRKEDGEVGRKSKREGQQVLFRRDGC